jgi:hypothetical protein
MLASMHIPRGITDEESGSKASESGVWEGNPTVDDNVVSFWYSVADVAAICYSIWPLETNRIVL